MASSSVAAAGCTTPVFGTPTIYGSDWFNQATSADFDGDGALDLAVVNTDLPDFHYTFNLNLHYGDGRGGISSRAEVSSLGNALFATSIAAGDFDSDGHPDLVVTSGLPARGNASLYLYADLFQVEIPLQWKNTPARTGTDAATVADFNADGRDDLAVVSYASNEVFIALGSAAGKLTDFKIFSTGGLRPVDLAAQDFNGDGKLDLAVAHMGDLRANKGNVAMLSGDGAGNFVASAFYPAGDYPTDLATGDFNADNKIDLAVRNQTGGFGLVGVYPTDIVILSGNSAGTFAAPSHFASRKEYPTDFLAADFNADGKTDLATLDRFGSVSILLGDGAGNFDFSGHYNSGSGEGRAFIAPDMDADGKPDLLVGGEQSTRFALLLNACGATTSRISFGPKLYANLDEEYSVNEGGTVTITVNRSGSLAGAVTVDYATSDGEDMDKAVSPSDYAATSGTFSFADGEATKTFTVQTFRDAQDEIHEKFYVRLTNPTGTAVLRGGTDAGVHIYDETSTPAYSASSSTVTEGEGHATVTVTRLTHPSVASSLNYRTKDDDTFTVGCADTTHNSGGAYARCDFVATAGRLDFAPGEMQKTVTIPIIDDGYREGTETFAFRMSNAMDTGYVQYLEARTFEATVTLQDNDAANIANPIFTTPFFVRQHYFDFLSREPEAGEPWTAVLNKCPDVNNDPACDRIAVSQSFFGAPEFQMKGFYVFRLYKLAFDRLPEYKELIEDMSFVAGATEAEVYARKAQLAFAFTLRKEFAATDDLRSNAAFVSMLLDRYQLAQITASDPAQPDGTTKVTLTKAALIDALNTDVLSRARVLRAVADSDEVKEREFNHAFVAMQYYSYLRRKPEPAGYAAWLDVLRRGDTRTMVNGFVNSTEYKLRFGGL